MNEPIIQRFGKGEYSTVELSDGTIETIYFGDDGSQRIVGRERGDELWIKAIARKHLMIDGGY